MVGISTVIDLGNPMVSDLSLSTIFTEDDPKNRLRRKDYKLLDNQDGNKLPFLGYIETTTIKMGFTYMMTENTILLFMTL